MGEVAIARPSTIPVLDKETERQEQAKFWELPAEATWPQIRDRVYERNDPFVPPADWELTMKSNFGSDLFEPRPILVIY